MLPPIQPMTPARLAAIRAAFPGLPDDYFVWLARVDTGVARKQYGARWLASPERPAEAGARERFPTALWVARRDGQVIGYADDAPRASRLYEWGASQRQVVKTYAGMADFVLDGVLRWENDGRPPVPCSLRVEGLACGPWRDLGDTWLCRCIIVPGAAAALPDHLFTALGRVWSMTLVGADNDSWLSLTASDGRYTFNLARHGSSGETRAIARSELAEALLAWAPYNDGCHASSHATLSVPAGTA